MTDSEIRSPFRRRGFIAAAIVIAIIVIAAIIALVGSIARGGNTPTATPTTSPTASTTTKAADRSICGLTGFETKNSLTTAPKTTWALVGTVAAPTDPKGAGPGTIENGLRTCYEHTARGALYMAVNFVAMGTDANLYDRLPQLVAPGPGRDSLVRAAANGPSVSSIRAQVAGYSIGAYSSESVTVDLALNYSTGQLLSLPLKLIWAEGDWKVAMTDEGKPPIAAAPLSNLGGFTPWSGA